MGAGSAAVVENNRCRRGLEPDSRASLGSCGHLERLPRKPWWTWSDVRCKVRNTAFDVASWIMLLTDMIMLVGA